MGQEGLRGKLDTTMPVVLASVTALGIFVLDLSIPLGYAVWIAYGLPVLVMSRVPVKTSVWLPVTALACTGLIAAGYLCLHRNLAPHDVGGESDNGRRFSVGYDRRTHEECRYRGTAQRHLWEPSAERNALS